MINKVITVSALQLVKPSQSRYSTVIFSSSSEIKLNFPNFLCHYYLFNNF